MIVACGQCVGCRISRSQEWMIRCVHEAQMHDDNSFLTLTFNNDHLPCDRSISVRDLQLFMKRVRKKYGNNIRFFACGEYGEPELITDGNLGRPHYHLLIFGLDFGDKYPWELRRGNLLYRSESLEQLWPYGFSTIGSLTTQSAGYVARYILKKVTGEVADDHYVWQDPDDGEIFWREPEFVTMSRGRLVNPDGSPGVGGIGDPWLKEYAYTDAWHQDYVVLDNRKYPVPRFYQKRLEKLGPTLYAANRGKRKRAALTRKIDNTRERLAARERVMLGRLGQLKREL